MRPPRPTLRRYHDILKRLPVTQRIVLHRLLRDAEDMAFAEGVTCAKAILFGEPVLAQLIPQTAVGASLDRLLEDADYFDAWFYAYRNEVARKNPDVFYPQPDPIPLRADKKGTFEA